MYEERFTKSLERLIAQDKFFDPRNVAKIEQEFRARYGIVREPNESIYDLINRADQTLNHKADPLSWLGLSGNALLQNARAHTETTRRVQRVTAEFLDIEEEPLDAYETSSSKGANGFQISEPDGSGVVFLAKDLEDDFTSDMRRFKSDIAYYLAGKDVERRTISLRIDMIMASFGNSPEAVLFKNWLGDVYKNYDYVALHEGIHNIDGNARRSENDAFCEKAKIVSNRLLRLLPVVGLYFGKWTTAYSVDAECTAFKVGNDAYIEKSFDFLRREYSMSGESAKKLHDLQHTFYDMASHFTKEIIKKPYLKTKGLGSAVSTVGRIAVAYGLYRFLDVENPDTFLSHASDILGFIWGVTMWSRIANAIPRVKLYEEFEEKIDAYVDAWDKVLRREGIKAGFNNTLGMTCEERVTYANNL